MTRALLIALLAVPGLALADSPAMVTTARGTVTQADGTAAPTPPFLLQDGQSLSVAAGGVVVVLYQGQATQISGPATVSRDTLKTRATTADASVAVLDELLTRGASTATAGASRGVGDVRVVRPVPGSDGLGPHEIRWECGGCGPQEVRVQDLLEDSTLWTGTGDGSVTYDGPALPPGAYAVVLGGRDHVFTVADAPVQEKAREAAKAAEAAAAGLDDAARAATVASVYLQAGLPTEALYTIDAALAAHPGDPTLTELRATFEARAGVGR